MLARHTQHIGPTYRYLNTNFIECCYSCGEDCNPVISCHNCNTIYCSEQCATSDRPRHQTHCSINIRGPARACNDAIQSILTGNSTFRIILGALLYHWKVDKRSYILCTIERAAVQDNCLAGISYNVELTYVHKSTGYMKKEVRFALMRMQFRTKTFDLYIGVPYGECLSSSKLLRGIINWPDMKSGGLNITVSNVGYVSFMHNGTLYYCDE